MFCKYFFVYSCLVLLILVGVDCKGPSSHKAYKAPVAAVHTSQHVRKNILFFGNSLTAGYGLDDIAQAFPSLIQREIDSLSLPYHCINAGLSGETSAGGKNRLNWILKNKVDIFVLELGANDGLRGISLDTTQANLQTIIARVRAKYPHAKMLMCGMLVPPNLGEVYSHQFKVMFPSLAKNNKMELVPFLLEGVAGKPSLNQADGIHPTAAGARIVAGNVWRRLRPML